MELPGRLVHHAEVKPAHVLVPTVNEVEAHAVNGLVLRDDLRFRRQQRELEGFVGERGNRSEQQGRGAGEEKTARVHGLILAFN